MQKWLRPSSGQADILGESSLQDGGIQRVEAREAAEAWHLGELWDDPLILLMGIADEGNARQRHAPAAQCFNAEQTVVDRAERGAGT